MEEDSTWPKNALQGLIYRRREEGEAVKSKQAPCPATVQRGAALSSILHAGACLKLLLLDSAWAAWLCCPGPSGSPVSPPVHTHTHTDKPCDANPPATMTPLFSLCHKLRSSKQVSDK